ncbi:ABC transporter ATP-binding protein [Stappia sp. ES.058]|uniref:ABC transporter ATP-binding protein n=1 Tax=Stappia sp. ES.058 TaxID=1881061 RepID=UPI00087B41E3|nr:ABC transporter ATP-binding protein [Stappia sp. ES.058]SDU03734.1 iron complex transport system ATP-binding protein [Stappia sp. ES.058]
MTHSTGSPVAVSLEGVAFAPSGKPSLVRDMSFHVHAGEILAIAGPNGAGKTTLVRMIAGLSDPTEGDIRLWGTRLREIPAAERARRIAYVGQMEDPDTRLTIAQYVSLGHLPHSGRLGKPEPGRSLADAIALCGLEDLAHRQIGSLSGGERQRAKLARAICQRPQLLVLDEPTNHLDPNARGALLGLVAGLGITVVAALHDLTLIDAFASHVALVRGGRLEAYGHPQDVLSLSNIRKVFDVGFHRLPHPSEDRHLSVLDVSLGQASFLPAAKGF